MTACASDIRTQVRRYLRTCATRGEYVGRVTGLYARAGMVERMELLQVLAGAHWEESRMSGGPGEPTGDGAEVRP